MIKRELCLKTPKKLEILLLLTNMLSTHQADYCQAMNEKPPTINFMVAQFS